jgi:pimeloyl-ACP methyl ester carboxylesterase
LSLRSPSVRRHPWGVALVAALAIAIALWRLLSASSGLEVTAARVGVIPVTTFHPANAGPAPVVVIAHGFASSQEMMQPFALTLARNGYCVVSFDFPGHGRNPTSMPGGLEDHVRRTDSLIAALSAVVAYARHLPCSDGRLALLGHSMGSEVVVRYAIAHPEVGATVGISLFSRDASATQPRNLLVIAGVLEPQMLKAEGLRVASLAARAPAVEHVTYGSFADGTARRFALAAGVEHIGVLYSRESQVEALAWLNRAFRHHGDGFVDARGPWLGLLFAGLVALGWPLSLLLPKVRTRPARPPMRRRVFLSIALLPAVVTPLMLWKAPTDFLPIVLGDYLAVHFTVYGLITGIGLWLARKLGPDRGASMTDWRKLALAALGVTAYATLAIGIPADLYVASFAAGGARWPLFAVLFVGTLTYFTTNEWLTGSPEAPPGASVIAWLCFLGSLMIAIVLNLQKLYFLAIIVPVILLLFVVYGLFSTWAYRRTGHPLPGAIANAVVFAWAMASMFPLVT